MSPVHHIDQANLVRFAAGELDEAFSIVVATHLAMCPHCRAELAAAEAVGGSLLTEVEPETMSDGALDKIMSALDAEPDVAAAHTPIKVAARSDVPQPLHRLVGDRLDQIKWRTVAPGVGKAVLTHGGSKTNSLFMLKIAPGLEMPEHGHGGDEMTLILQGAYRDEIGLFDTGDIADLDDHVEHTPRVEGDIDCICLVATEKPTRFKTWVGKIMQPFVGI